MWYCEEAVTFFLSDAELEAGGDCDEYMNEGRDVLILGEGFEYSVDGHPGFVFVCDDDGEDFFVEFDEFIVFVATNDC